MANWCSAETIQIETKNQCFPGGINMSKFQFFFLIYHSCSRILSALIVLRQKLSMGLTITVCK